MSTLEIIFSLVIGVPQAIMAYLHLYDRFWKPGFPDPIPNGTIEYNNAYWAARQKPKYQWDLRLCTFAQCTYIMAAVAGLKLFLNSNFLENPEILKPIVLLLILIGCAWEVYAIEIKKRQLMIFLKAADEAVNCWANGRQS